MTIQLEIIEELRRLTQHEYVDLTLSGDAAIEAALLLCSPGQRLLIPEEGGWLSYEKLSKKRSLACVKVKCDQAKINLVDLRANISGSAAFLYQNPGGYFARQFMKEIYELCHAARCLVIMDVSGALGTELCDGRYADVMVGSFGKWKLVEAQGGGFISSSNIDYQCTVTKNMATPAEEQLPIIRNALGQLSQRIEFLLEKREKILLDLKSYDIMHKNDLGFVVVVKYHSEEEREKIVTYCQEEKLPFTECPRYIRLMERAISIEVKKLQE